MEWCNGMLDEALIKVISVIESSDQNITSDIHWTDNLLDTHSVLVVILLPTITTSARQARKTREPGAIAATAVFD